MGTKLSPSGTKPYQQKALVPQGISEVDLRL
ncbi:hypothetical protein T01_5963 [Trichinella spiralis]|uniref:Uncharacterized protein n=1 Tax=Trichinella spiralis TaxID=6334 RepID=A0A0V0YQX1_TRISP|nr:hypothetical protein T01_5963 [Trichinella spiralis]